MPDLQAEIRNIDRQVIDLEARRERLLVQLGARALEPTLQSIRALFPEEAFTTGKHCYMSDRRVYSVVARETTSASFAEIGEAIGRASGQTFNMYKLATDKDRQIATKMMEEM